KVGSDIAYPPVEYKDKSGKVVGIDIDLAEALGKELGVTFEFQNATFDTLLTGLRSKRYDLAMSAMTDT
ncbi:transporter substrate-binding domain-containing protein, partial [Streptomyces sp. SID11233]|nr:transporter substrate-binding domain-containing protein [Streptomyces sp. SID11233]